MRYEICVEGHLHPRWSATLYDIQVTHLTDGTTSLEGPLPDDAAIYGLLAKLRDLGLTLVSVRRQPSGDWSRSTSPGDE
jgi:hypothetical protein